MLTLRKLRREDSIEELTYLLHRAYARLGAVGLNYTAVDQVPAWHKGDRFIYLMSAL